MGLPAVEAVNYSDTRNSTFRVNAFDRCSAKAISTSTCAPQQLMIEHDAAFSPARLTRCQGCKEFRRSSARGKENNMQAPVVQTVAPYSGLQWGVSCADVSHLLFFEFR
jgi:hypothetical protein